MKISLRNGDPLVQKRDAREIFELASDDALIGLPRDIFIDLIDGW